MGVLRAWAGTLTGEAGGRGEVEGVLLRSSALLQRRPAQTWRARGERTGRPERWLQ